MAFQNLCPPALIYLIFSVTQVVIDTVKGLYNTALIKVWVTIYIYNIIKLLMSIRFRNNFFGLLFLFHFF